MSKQDTAAEIIATSARAMIRAMGMCAENANREYRGEAPAYAEKAFFAIIEEEGIGHSAVVSSHEDKAVPDRYDIGGGISAIDILYPTGPRTKGEG